MTGRPLSWWTARLAVLHIYLTERGSWTEAWVKWAMRKANRDLRRMGL